MVKLTDAKTDVDLVGKLDAEFDKRKNAMAPIYREWEVNEQFYNDKHWVKWDSNLKHLIDNYPKFSRGRELIQVNRIREYMRIMAAQLSTGKPNVSTLPATQASEDVAAAKFAERMWKFIQRINDVDIVNHYINFNKLMYGTAIKMVDWGVIRGKGNVVLENVHPREILPRLDSTGDFDKCIRYRAVELDVLRQLYDSAKDVQPDEGTDGLPAEGVSTMLVTDSKFDEPVIFKEWYEEPSEDDPRGRYIAWAGETLLDDSAGKYPTGRTPFIRYIFDIPAPPGFWGISYLKSLIPLQVRLNKTLTMANDYIKRSIKVIIPSEDGTNIDLNAFRSSDTFTTFPIAPGSQPPIPIQMPNMTADVYKQIEILEMQLMDLAHIHLVTKGMAERNVRSAAGLSVLREQDESPLSTTVQNFEQGEVQSAQMALELAREFYDDTTQIRVVGEDNRVYHEAFDKSSISDEIDVVVEPNSAMPRSQAAQRETLIEMYRSGVFQPGDPRLERVVKEMMQYNAIDVLFDEEELNKANAMKEHEALKKGEEIEPQAWEDHITHMRVHGRLLMSDEFLTWAPEEQQYLITHYQDTEGLYDQNIQKNAQRVQSMSGQTQDQAESGAMRMAEIEV